MEKICPQCGHVNRAAGIFCAKCGARMTGPVMADSRRRRSFNPLKFLWTLIKLAVTLALVALLVGLLWPPPIPDPIEDAPRADHFEGTVDRLLEAARAKRAHAETFAEHDINAYLSRQIAKMNDAAASSGTTVGAVGLRQIRVDIDKDRVRVTADTSYGPARLVWSVAGKPVANREGFSLLIDETRLGRLPIPVRYGGWIADKVRGTVQGLENEREVLNAARQFELADDKVRVVVGP